MPLKKYDYTKKKEPRGAKKKSKIEKNVSKFWLPYRTMLVSSPILC
jgi:hypothetical protein